MESRRSSELHTPGVSHVGCLSCASEDRLHHSMTVRSAIETEDSSEMSHVDKIDLQLLEATDGAFVITDPHAPDNPIVYASSGFEHLSGYALEEVIGRNCRFMQGPATSPEAVQTLREALAKGREETVKILNYRKDGSSFLNLLNIAPLRDKDGNVKLFIGMQRDLTKLQLSGPRPSLSQRNGAAEGSISSSEGEGSHAQLMGHVANGHGHHREANGGAHASGMEMRPVGEGEDLEGGPSVLRKSSNYARMEAHALEISVIEDPVMIQFDSVEVAVNKAPPPTFWQRQTGVKPVNMVKILHEMSGNVIPGELLALMGPSGSGKTTLLSCVGGRFRGEIHGQILYNGEKFGREMKKRTGFVDQDDMLFANLTVRETLMFAALLKLPDDMPRKAKATKVAEVMASLGLTKCANTIIGSHFVRGISGGERKRVSIGHEMLTDPAIILLDEPTSGLDSTTALRIIRLLKTLALAQRTIITTVHQPSSRMYNMFDKLMLLTDGHIMFYGCARDAMPFFAKLGYAPNYNCNPADYLLDLAMGEVADDAGLPAPEVKEKLLRLRAESLGPKIEKKRTLADLQLEHQQTMTTLRRTGAAPVVHKQDHWLVKWTKQVTYLAQRSVLERRFETFGSLRLFNVLSIALICGMLWFNSDDGTAHGVNDTVGLLFFNGVFWGFFPLFSAIFTFPSERVIFVKERKSGMYPVSAYFMARTVADLPLELVMPSLYILVEYWMVGLNPKAGRFFATWALLLLNVLVAQVGTEGGYPYGKKS
eukprot:jgi/Mesvir1/8171/Mv12476-RA.1